MRSILQPCLEMISKKYFHRIERSSAKVFEWSYDEDKYSMKSACQSKVSGDVQSAKYRPIPNTPVFEPENHALYG